MKHFTLLLMATITTLFNVAFATDIDSTRSANSILYEKIYLHVDRELYAPGDNIWFKSYLVSGINNKLIPGYKNIYVQLISESGEPVEKRLILSKDGTAHGDILLSENITEGEYTLRAFTKYLGNFGEESYFHRKIVISGSKNSLELENQTNEEKNQKIDVDFLPEGGTFVLNAINHIAFKAINEEGKGVNVRGKVVDETGAEVVAFRTTYKGMGKFIMMPQEGKNYFVLIDDHPEFNYQFEAASPDGISLNYKPDGNYLLFTITRNLKAVNQQNLTLKATHKGIELFNSRITMNEFQHAQRLYKGLFPLGLSKITVLDEYDNIIAERMVFIRNKDEKSIQLDINKEDFTTRERVKIDVSSLLPETDTIISNLSVSVVHEDYFSSTGNNQTI